MMKRILNFSINNLPLALRNSKIIAAFLQAVSVSLDDMKTQINNYFEEMNFDLRVTPQVYSLEMLLNRKIHEIDKRIYITNFTTEIPGLYFTTEQADNMCYFNDPEQNADICPFNNSEHEVNMCPLCDPEQEIKCTFYDPGREDNKCSFHDKKFFAYIDPFGKDFDFLVFVPEYYEDNEDAMNKINFYLDKYKLISTTYRIIFIK